MSRYFKISKHTVSKAMKSEEEIVRQENIKSAFHNGALELKLWILSLIRGGILDESMYEKYYNGAGQKPKFQPEWSL